jgi:ankyrin repeat protein
LIPGSKIDLFFSIKQTQNMLSDDIIDIIYNDDVDRLKNIVTPSNLEWIDREGNTMLRLTATTHNSKLKCMKFLLDLGANVNSTNKKDRSVVHAAVAMERLDKLKILLQHRPNLNIMDDENDTPLQECLTVLRGDNRDKIAQMLILTGAEFNINYLPKCIVPFAQSVQNARYLRKNSTWCVVMIWSKRDSLLKLLPKDILKMIITLLATSDIDSWIKCKSNPYQPRYNQ